MTTTPTRDPRARFPREFENYQNVQRLWWHVNGWDPPDRVSLDMMEKMQYGGDRIVFAGHRGSTKTESALAFSCAHFDGHRDDKILYSSSTPSVASDGAVHALEMVKKVSILQHLAPVDVERGSKGSGMKGFDVRGARRRRMASFRPTTVMTAYTGGRPDIVLLDDPENKENTATQHLRSLLQVRVTEYLNVLAAGGRFIVDMTPHTEESLLNWFRDRGFEVIYYPLRYPTVADLSRFGTSLAPMLQKDIDEHPELMTGGGEDGTMGQPINPGRLGEDYCRLKLAELKIVEFSLQMMLDTSPAMAQKPMRCQNFSVYDMDPRVGPERVMWGMDEKLDLPCLGMSGDAWYKPQAVMGWAPWERKIMTIDPAAMGGDEVAYACGGLLNGHVSVFELFGLQGGYAQENLLKLARAAVRWGVECVYVESNLGLGMFASLLQSVLFEEARARGLSIGIELRPAKGSKNTRIIDTVAPALQDHRISLNRSLVERDYRDRDLTLTEEQAISFMLAYQVTRITRKDRCLRHDDRADVLFALVREFEDGMRESQNIQLARSAEQDQENRYRRMLESVQSGGALRLPGAPEKVPYVSPQVLL